MRKDVRLGKVSHEQGGIRSDETIEFHVFSSRRIKGSYRRVRVWLEDKGEELVLLTNRPGSHHHCRYL